LINTKLGSSQETGDGRKTERMISATKNAKRDTILARGNERKGKITGEKKRGNEKEEIR